MNLKRTVKNMFARVTGERLWRVLRRPMLAPRQYQRLIAQTEAMVLLKEDPRRLDESYWAHMLRMYAHIVDKGVQRCDWEAGHSAQCHALAKEALSHIPPARLHEDPSMIWALRTIEEYERRQCNGVAPTPREPVPPSRCGYDDLVDTIKTRRSIRTYIDKPLDAQTIGKIVEVINWSATSCNRQTARVFVAASPEVASQCLKTCGGATCFSDNVPAFFAFCSDTRSYSMPEEIFLPHVDVCLGVQNCCLAAHALGVSITLLSWARNTPADEIELRRILGIPEYCQIIVAGAAGYPMFATPAPHRKSVEETLTIIQRPLGELRTGVEG